jgi:MoaA/NifB/PqqE/SkfB family radical SAM enzyme
MITEAQIFLTRKCNMNCGYCKLVENQSLKELDYSDWMKAWRIMERIGIKTVKLMGGEPTVKEWLPDLLSFASRTSIKTAVLSNSCFDDTMLRRIKDSLPWGYFASVDSLNSLNSHKDPVKKSLNGYQTLKALKFSNIPIKAANVVINKHNYKDVPAIIQQLSDEGFWCNLCAVQHTTDTTREFSRATIKRDYLFTEEDRPAVQELAAELIRMKRYGVKISVPESYILGLATYGIDCNWKCDKMVQLRIDADGSFTLCNEYRTELADDYNILDMTPEKFDEFVNVAWPEARKKIDCSGCYWSCFLQAKDNIEKKRLEFDYAASRNILRS